MERTCLNTPGPPGTQLTPDTTCCFFAMEINGYFLALTSSGQPLQSFPGAGFPHNASPSSPPAGHTGAQASACVTGSCLIPSCPNPIPHLRPLCTHWCSLSRSLTPRPSDVAEREQCHVLSLPAHRHQNPAAQQKDTLTRREKEAHTLQSCL